jgi:hypothetical protein
VKLPTITIFPSGCKKDDSGEWFGPKPALNPTSEVLKVASMVPGWAKQKVEIKVVIENRIENNLKMVSKVVLVSLPQDTKPLTLENFVQMQNDYIE